MEAVCLPFLPEEHILPTFEHVRDFNTANHVEPLLDYMESTWMINRVWPPSEWSMFCEDENKDVEGNFRDYRENDCLSDMHNNDIFEKTKQIRRPQLAICYKNH